MLSAQNVHDFIMDKWDGCVRFEPEDKDTFIGLPYPYIVPTCKGIFQEMYYWDTYFACEGLILSGRTELAKNCAENMAFLTEKYGFVPNGNRTVFLSRSQPPYFCMLADAVYKQTRDLSWLRKMYPFIEKEYEFWQTERISPVGLNRYGTTGLDAETAKDVCEYIKGRFASGNITDGYENEAVFAENIIAECESGWDFNPRFGLRCKEYAPVDLNSNLFLYETKMAEFSSLLNNGRENEWADKAERRKELINKYLWNGSFYSDYNFEKDEISALFSAAAFHPLWAGAADEKRANATRLNLPKIELDFGIAACEKTVTEIQLQWAYPNAWAPLQFITVFGLDCYGFKEDAKRIAGKYVNAIDGIFKETHNLWEKYNAVDGTINVVNEYEMPEMLGWTAGVYLKCRQYISDNSEV